MANSPGDILLGPLGEEVLLPGVGRQLSEHDLEISREDRVASGKLVRDIIATKKIFTLNYGIITGEDLESFEQFYSLHNNLNLIIVNRDSSIRSYTVCFRPFKRSRWILTGGWLWRNVSIVLEEV